MNMMYKLSHSVAERYSNNPNHFTSDQNAQFQYYMNMGQYYYAIVDPIAFEMINDFLSVQLNHLNEIPDDTLYDTLKKYLDQKYGRIDSTIEFFDDNNECKLHIAANTHAYLPSYISESYSGKDNKGRKTVFYNFNRNIIRENHKIITLPNHCSLEGETGICRTILNDVNMSNDYSIWQHFKYYYISEGNSNIDEILSRKGIISADGNHTNVEIIEYVSRYHKDIFDICTIDNIENLLVCFHLLEIRFLLESKNTFPIILISCGEEYNTYIKLLSELGMMRPDVFYIFKGKNETIYDDENHLRNRYQVLVQ